MSTIDSMRATLVPGPGLVARYRHVVLLVAEAEPGRGAARLVDAVRETAASEEQPGKQLARRLAELLLRDDAGELPPFAAVASGPDGLVVFVSGEVAAEVAGDEPATLQGRDAATWVDRVVPGAVTSLTLRPDPGAEARTGAGPTYELDGGVVPAAAVSLAGSRAPGTTAPSSPPPDEVAAPIATDTTAAGPAEEDATDEVDMDMATPPSPPAVGTEGTAEPEEADDAVAGAEFQVVALDDLSDLEGREPLPVVEADTGATSEAPTGGDVEDQAMVQGIVCSRHHLNNPEANYCSVCGVSMVHVTHNLVTGPRPPLGFMVFDDGSTFTLDLDDVLGREPETADERSMRSIPLDDPERTISRVHAEVRLEGWEVKLVDRGSSNGSFVWDEPGRRWHRLDPHEPVTIVPGAHVALGRRTFRYETPHQPV